MTEMTPAVLKADDRFELDLAAETRDRRNRPRMVVVLGLLALGAAGVSVIFTTSQAEAARRSLRFEERRRSEFQASAAKIAELKAKLDAGGARAQPAFPVVSELQSLAEQAGLARRPNPPVESNSPQRDVTVRSYDFRDVQSPTIEPIMRWLELATTSVPGLTVDGLTLRNNPQGWTMNVKFQRLERAQ